jgi:hypothetical protein
MTVEEGFSAEGFNAGALTAGVLTAGAAVRLAGVAAGFLTIFAGAFLTGTVVFAALTVDFFIASIPEMIRVRDDRTFDGLFCASIAN